MTSTLRLAIIVAPIRGGSYLPGDLVYVSTDAPDGEALRVHHVVASRKETTGAWAPPDALLYAPAGTAKDDLKLALVCHRIARNAGTAVDSRASAEAYLVEAFGRDLVTG